MRKIIIPLAVILFCAVPAISVRAETDCRGAGCIPVRMDETLDDAGRPLALGDTGATAEFDGEFRYRLEYRDDFNFNDRAYEDDAINLFRTRLGLKLIPVKGLTLYAQGQDAESFADQLAHRSSLFVNRLDLRQLWFEVDGREYGVPLAVKTGRQELSYGDQRFIGGFDWSNVARVFDAVKVMLTPYDWFSVDAWFSQVLEVNRSQPDSARHHENFYGIYASVKPVKDHVLDSFLFIRHNRDNDIRGEIAGNRGQLKEYTAGNRFKGKKWNFDYGIEWAKQFGSRAHEDIRAWAWHNEIGYTFVKLPADPRVMFEYNFGSGDSDPDDGIYGNFENLYPTNHLHYGYMDLASLRNIHNFKIGVDIKPHARWKFQADHHWFFLDTNGSAWFNAGQAVIRPRNPNASITIGQETDLTAAWKAAEHLNLLIGYSHFHAGAFIDDTGAADNANFFYVQTKLNF